jgi:mono/diheme cytochrome c family protein
MSRDRPAEWSTADALVNVTVSPLSERAESGQAVFEANCLSCHGAHGAGSKAGPPLVNKIYEPAHHPDPSFYRAVSRGVRQHHWKFGDMPSVRGVDKTEVADVIAYVRELQRANGIR